MARTEPEVRGSQELPLAPDDVGVTPTTPAIKWLRAQQQQQQQQKWNKVVVHIKQASTTLETMDDTLELPMQWARDFGN
jgi:hypothetical protein